MLTFFKNASEAFYGTANSPGLSSAQQHLIFENNPDFHPGSNPLLSKQAIIVLREELEYFSIPPNDAGAATDTNGTANEEMLEIKRRSGEYLMEKKNIFTALQRNVNKENNVAEQHLIDMLCMRQACLLFPFDDMLMVVLKAVLIVKTSGDIVPWNQCVVVFRR